MLTILHNEENWKKLNFNYVFFKIFRRFLTISNLLICATLLHSMREYKRARMEGTRITKQFNARPTRASEQLYKCRWIFQSAWYQAPANHLQNFCFNYDFCAELPKYVLNVIFFLNFTIFNGMIFVTRIPEF